MKNSNELRIGNIIGCDGNILIVEKIDKQNNVGCSLLEKSKGQHVNSGIKYFVPLTEQYLLDFEFIHNEENNVFELNGFLIYKQDVFWFDLISDSIEIEYVHQLQNLYFALKKEELIKKS